MNKIINILTEFFNAIETDFTELEDAETFVDCNVRTFDEEGLLTYHEGLVIETKDGKKFVITIVEM